MLNVTEHKVEFYFDTKDPITKLAYELEPEKVEKCVMLVDLKVVFEAISSKYGLATCADLVQQAMESASDKYKKDA